MPGPIQQALLLIIGVIFFTYEMALILRIMLAFTGISYHNPIIHLLKKASDPLVKPLQKLLPRVRAFDLPTLVVLFCCNVIKLMLTISITQSVLANPIACIVLTIPDLMGITVDILFFALIIVVILSWIQPQQYNPAVEILQKITDPLLKQAGRLIPPLGGIDFSPMLAIVMLKLIDILIVNPLFIYLGRML